MSSENTTTHEPNLFEDEYRILETLGEGAFGTVYLAHQKGMERNVALKVLKSDLQADENAKNLFLQEVQIISQLKHPHTVTIHDFGETASGQIYMVLEYLEGQTLAGLLNRQNRLAPDLTTRLMQQVLSGLEEAHESGVIHRDLKPENIIITEVNRSEFAKILDFGVAQLAQSSDINLTAVGEAEDSTSFVGTPQFMSPEQIEGSQLGPKSDIYSLGLVFYETLTGIPAVSGETAFECMGAHLKEDPLELPELETVPDAAAQIIRKMTAKSPQERYTETGEVLSDLHKLEEQLLAQQKDKTSNSSIDFDYSDPVSYSNDRFLRSEELYKTLEDMEGQFEGNEKGLRLDPETGELVSEENDTSRGPKPKNNELSSPQPELDHRHLKVDKSDSQTSNESLSNPTQSKTTKPRSTFQTSRQRTQSQTSEPSADEPLFAPTTKASNVEKTVSFLISLVTIYFGSLYLAEGGPVTRLLPGLALVVSTLGIHFLLRWQRIQSNLSFSRLLTVFATILFVGLHLVGWSTIQIELMSDPIWYAEYIPGSFLEDSSVARQLENLAEEYVFLVGKIKSLF